MRIAIWWQQESWGGVDTHLAALLDGWPAKGDSFTVFHNSANPGLARIADALRARNVKTVAMPEWLDPDAGLARRLLNRLVLPLRFGRWIRRTRRLLDAHGPFDVLLVDDGAYPGAWTGLAALAAGHGLDLHRRMLLVHHSATGYGFGQALFEQLVDQGVQRWATDLVAVSRATRASLINLRHFNTERNPIRVIHNGIRQPAEAGRDEAVRAGWGCGEKEFVVGMIGRVERYKGHEDVLLGMSEMADDVRARIRLVVVGLGPDDELARLRRIAEGLGLAGQLHFAGYMPQDPVFIARQFDLLAMATKDFEGFGLALAEAMAAGTPVLATSVGGIPEFVTPEVGLLVPPESPTDIARAIEDAVRNPDAAAARAASARSHIAGFSSVAMARRFHRLLAL